jgi:hypothetical protein
MEKLEIDWQIYCGNSQYLNEKSSPHGDQALCVNASVVIVYWCGNGVVEQVRDHQAL